MSTVNPQEFQKFYDFGQEMYQDMIYVFSKYLKRDAKYAFLHTQSMPINIFFHMIEKMEAAGLNDLMENNEVPGSLIRMLKPLEKIQDQWGKVSMKEFNDLYSKEYAEVMKQRYPEEGDLFEKLQQDK